MSRSIAEGPKNGRESASRTVTSGARYFQAWVDGHRAVACSSSTVYHDQLWSEYFGPRGPHAPESHRNRNLSISPV